MSRFLGPVALFAYVRCRLDEPTPTAGDRLLAEEIRVLHEQLGDRRLRLTDDQRRRLAAKAKGLGRNLLRDVATIVTPETLLAWHRRLIAQNYDGTANRGPGRPRTCREIETLILRMAEENRDWATGLNIRTIRAGARCPFFIQRDDMVEDLAAAASDPSFSGSVLPWGSNAGPFCVQAGRLQERNDVVAKDGVVSQNGVAIGSRRVRKGFAELLHDPIYRRMPCNSEMQDAATFVLDDEEAV